MSAADYVGVLVCYTELRVLIINMKTHCVNVQFKKSNHLCLVVSMKREVGGSLHFCCSVGVAPTIYLFFLPVAPQPLKIIWLRPWSRLKVLQKCNPFNIFMMNYTSHLFSHSYHSNRYTGNVCTCKYSLPLCFWVHPSWHIICLCLSLSVFLHVCTACRHSLLNRINQRPIDDINLSLTSQLHPTEQMIRLDFGVSCCIKWHINVEKLIVSEAVTTP